MKTGYKKGIAFLAVFVGSLSVSMFATEVSERSHYLNELSKDKAVVEKGKASYQVFCMACHGDESVSVDAVSNLFDEKWYRGSSPEGIENSIISGYLDTGMPPWGQMIPTEDIEALVAYLIAPKG